MALDAFADLIEPFQRRGVDLGLERLTCALADLGHPERRFRTVQVAGTNGKGSIATLVHAALLQAGIRCGLYTSPHLVSWCERIRLGAAPIPAPELRRQLEALQRVGQRHRLTPFELVTAAAFCAFAEADLELVVLEVGLGGRLDATTVHPRREVIGFAAIGMDHAEFLGSDPGQIAAEKAGVLRPGSVAISGPQSPAVAAVLQERAETVGAELRWIEPAVAADRGDDWLHSDGLTYRCGLSGAVQRHNSAVALGMLRALIEGGWPISEEAIAAGFAAARWPGRLQPVHWQGRSLLLDGAHNLPAAEALRAELDQRAAQGTIAAAGERIWLLGILANKQGPAMLRALLAPGDRAWIVPVSGHSCWSQDQLAEACPELASQLQAAADWASALNTLPPAGTTPLIVAGSLYLIGSLLAVAATE
ncbi:bifunctional folylpolyglutamate synthase/dihydrofolate synthase [Synechococcus sp. CCY9202]|uniref:bifunctional folylpolyglutamate synthase/dihydrofolate synthase n=1 Tax=Synechococcus sp. CCY9202 TaxID=174698 RepID=UPI002B1EA634|nr:bifunctional folylpolyglutamate synthase/dihydrofolate synthase [Synechococcus sp. CCY9202]MEA5422191.1 bifunctional folylpolyglutamate synthase/dihydrofolate synthase [Synechococcus sp. CCY9202]